MENSPNRPASDQLSPEALHGAIQESLRYLASEDAVRSIELDPYWPKWNSPWWHMSLLHELGMADRIPSSAARALIAAVRRQYPRGGESRSPSPCPCEMGNLYQFLTAAGIDVDAELPWARGWLLAKQMPDGGLSCDEDAYRAQPPASSIVGTIAPLEAVLFCTPREFTPDEERFLDAGAACLMDRRLMRGCAAPHNAEELLDEEDWLKPCFPRFYFYDVLRGLRFLAGWAEKRRRVVAAETLEPVLAILRREFPDGHVSIGRQAFAGVGSRWKDERGNWERGSATLFPLLEEVGRVGRESAELSREWREAQVRWRG